MTYILALSGRKQSGKNTAFNYLLGVELLKLAVVRNQIEIRSDGKLFISDIFGDDAYQGIFDIDRPNDTMRNFCSEYVWPFIRNYSFADCLKQDVCIDLLGLSHEQCYGTDEQKNQPTHLLWENMPGVIHRHIDDDKFGFADHDYGLYYHEAGPMTAREVMQYVGTEVFRKMYHKVWAKGTIKRVNKGGSRMSVLTDARFPNEIEEVHTAGGKAIRFTRGEGSDDIHESELALDRDRYDWDNFDAVIDNADMSISEQNEALYQILHQWEWMDEVKMPVPETTEEYNK